MKITIVCSSAVHPVNSYLQSWILKNKHHHQIDLVRNKADLSDGSLLFLISCAEIVTKSDRHLYEKALVIHASDLPLGRGWSPHIWQILGGATEVTITLLEAEDKVDSGAIWKKLGVSIDKDALWDEINHVIFENELKLMDFAVDNFDVIKTMPQSVEIEPTYHPKRSPVDSKIDPKKSIEQQFDIFRVCDPDRFPAYFELHGHKYIIRLEKS